MTAAEFRDFCLIVASITMPILISCFLLVAWLSQRKIVKQIKLFNGEDYADLMERSKREADKPLDALRQKLATAESIAQAAATDADSRIAALDDATRRLTTAINSHKAFMLGEWNRYPREPGWTVVLVFCENNLQILEHISRTTAALREVESGLKQKVLQTLAEAKEA